MGEVCAQGEKPKGIWSGEIRDHLCNNVFCSYSVELSCFEMSCKIFEHGFS